MSEISINHVNSTYDFDEVHQNWRILSFTAEIRVMPPIDSEERLAKILHSEDTDQLAMRHISGLDLTSYIEVVLGDRLAGHADLALDGIGRMIEKVHPDRVRCRYAEAEDSNHDSGCRFKPPGVKYSINYRPK